MKMRERLKQAVATFRRDFLRNFLRWTPAIALVFGVCAIAFFTIAHAVLRDDMTYLAIGGGALALLAFGLWPVRRFIPHILGLQAEFPSLHNNNETRRS